MKRFFSLSSKGQAPSSPEDSQGSGRATRGRVNRSVRKLHKAASEGDVARVQHLLLLRKSGLNDQDKKRRTALHFACTYGHPEVVTLLLERNCDIDAHDSDDNTALIQAVQHDKEDCAAILLQHGANPNIANVRGNTALHYAVLSKTTSIAAKLLSHNANTEAKNKDGLTPLLLALKKNRLEVAQLLEKKTTNNAMDKPGSTAPALPLREVKETESEHQSSTESVTSPVSQQNSSLSGGLLQVNSSCNLHDTDEDEGRSTKKTSNEKGKIKKKINAVYGLDDLSQSSKTPLEDSESPHIQYENILLLVEQLRVECKDSTTVLKIWDAIHSYKAVIELKKDHDEVLTGKIKILENKLRGLQKELTEAKEVKSQLKCGKIQREREIGNLRFALKQEEERSKTVDEFYEKIKEQLRKKEEQYCQEVEEKQQLEISLRALHMKLKTLEEAQDQHTEAGRHAEIQEHLEKLDLENSSLKVKIKEQAGRIEHLEEILLLSAKLSENDQEQLKKLTELKKYLEYTLDEEKKKNSELIKELTGLKKLWKMIETNLNEQENGQFCFHGNLTSSESERNSPTDALIDKIGDLVSKLETTSSKCLYLNESNQSLRQELLSMKHIQKKCESLEENKKNLEQEVLNLKHYIEKNVVKHDQLEQYKQKIEESARQELQEKLKQTHAESQEYLAQWRESNASVRIQMGLRIKDLESELSKMKTQEEINKIQLEEYKQLYKEELKTTELLYSKLNKAKERLEKANSKLLVKKLQSRSLLSAANTRPVLVCPCMGNLNHSSELHRSFLPRENLADHTLNPQPSNNSMENLFTRQQQLYSSINRELREATAELEALALKVSHRISANKSSQDLISEASQEYIAILRQKIYGLKR
ncbi:PREDICTED: LOW QUALITY PROTEIN: ankyrin repeat domain-containing protein 26-like [Chinchilla lanigera]|uniref:LOW QUALITY PROTEIN: ankyrin repeat domain-containing protein 26-like n=1 Tax=Chinchilla lanigera TaxID=34839 RepID=UPI000698FF3E|nr:PREDICTED: LOW QUALITY PROTEIN: ankyrin repeat domain-containing protein 26-like [Chinchilla lanigera]